jgi:voltage-gated potassium channel Kch
MKAVWIKFINTDSRSLGNTALFILTLITLFLVPVFPLALHKNLYDILFSAILLMAALAMEKNRKIIFIFALVAFITERFSEALDLSYLNALSRSINMIFFVIIVISLILQVARTRKVTAQVILASINGYLLTGILFALMIALLMWLDPESYSFSRHADFSGRHIYYFSDYLYFGFVTLTTVGYGDVVPLKPLSKSLSNLTSVTGQIYIAVIIAMLVGKYASVQNKE